LFIVDRDIGSTRGVRQNAVVVIIDFNGEGGESEPTTRVVADETATVAATPVDADGK
jgi:hypothetical protein